jgi:peptidyl-prolyl cis-trans isomerase SurA
MRNPLPARLPLVCTLPLALALALAGCAGSAPQRSVPPREREIDSGLRKAEASVARPAEGVNLAAKPAAIIAGEPVSDAEIRVYANEIAGGVVLEELALDRLVRQRCQSMGISISAPDVEQERRYVLESMARDAETSVDSASELLERLRRQRGLGPKRFNALLERNAMLRKLVAPTVSVSDEQVQQALAVRYGERRNARIILRNSQQEASASLERLRGLSGAALASAFSDEASRNSVDASAARGGKLEPISVSDPAYPSIVRTTLASLAEGQLSTLVAMDRGFAILLLEGIVPAATPPSNARELAREEVTRRAQRVAMDRLARDILLAGGVTAYDDSLRWSWENRADARQGR